MPTINPLLITQEWRDVGSDLAARRASRRAHFFRDGPPAGPVPDDIGRAPPAQRQELVAALRQLDALERTVTNSAAHAPIQPGERYHFDYPRLLADLARVRAGIQAHLTPSRAQPRDPAELAGDYRTERTVAPSPTTAEAKP
ncbi:RAQPRD family integrative conjugative element protein [Pseudomonas aeruginosa]|uniref:integrative conjugative element protein, RAQPRD family n=1 Tax=Pseudomonas aeruginosa TaxID=287 RepID=UPI003F8CF689